MNNVLDAHQCLFIPKAFKVLKTITENKWVIAKQGDYLAYETAVWNIKHCPFCGEKLA